MSPPSPIELPSRVGLPSHFEAILDRCLPREMQRRRLLQRAPPGALRDYLATPPPSKGTDVSAVDYLSLDLETTGLDPAGDEIVSFGWVCIDAERIDLASARHHVIQLRGAMSATSAPIHRITDDDCAAGRPLAAVLDELLAALAGRVLIAHRTETELGFIAQACRQVYGAKIQISAVDTLRIAARATLPGHPPPPPGALRLGALRRSHHLPSYRAHNALSDALGTAELFLAQVAQRRARRPHLPLADYLVRQP